MGITARAEQYELGDSEVAVPHVRYLDFLGAWRGGGPRCRQFEE
jgi:hypothetical protein